MRVKTAERRLAEALARQSNGTREKLRAMTWGQLAIAEEVAGFRGQHILMTLIFEESERRGGWECS